MSSELASERALIAQLAQIMASSPAPVAALLEMTVSCVNSGRDDVSAAVLRVGSDSHSWTTLAGTERLETSRLEAFTTELAEMVASNTTGPESIDESAWARPRPIQGGRHTAIGLYGSGRLLGILLLLDCPPARWVTVPFSVSVGLVMCLTGGIVRDAARTESAFVKSSARAIRRLFEEGAHARDVEEAGEVLARVAAEAFETERAGMYVVNAEGRIAFAVGVGVSAELSDALAESLLGKVAAESPVWQTLERAAGPSLVDDASQSDVRPGGFVQTLSFASYVAIPLLSKAGPLGMVICGEASRLRTWTAREHELAKQFALEGALIMDAARLRVSERAQLAYITHEAFHDGLTGVPNRTLLTDRMQQALSDAGELGTKVAVLVLDLDDFKRVNDTLGHRYGDELLREVATRLTSCLRAHDTLARLGGDEFAILITDDVGVDSALGVAARVNALLARPIDLDGVSLNAVASIGIAIYPDHAQTSSDLLQRADIAMYAAKRSGNGPAIYEPAQDDSAVEKLTLHSELRRAIDDEQLVLVYQPKLDLHRNTISGVEALVRWNHPLRGMLTPDEFLPMAESSGLIHAITSWVVRHALGQWQAWNADGVTLDLALNISARNLIDQALMAQIASLVRGSGAAEHLIFEVTETAVMIDPKRSTQSLSALRALGVRISMDDFGTGYSSLALLGQLPVDELKVDRQLVQDAEGSEVNSALIDAVVGVGHRLGLSVVAEGIETAATLRAVRELGCDLGQGYFISRPVPPADVTKLLQVRRLPVGVVAPELTGHRPPSGASSPFA